MNHWDYAQALDTLGYEATPWVRRNEESLRPQGRNGVVVIVPRGSEEAGELASKMVQALKLPTGLHLQTLIWEENESPSTLAALKTSARALLILGLELAPHVLEMKSTSVERGRISNPEGWENIDIFATHSPENCLRDPSLKRPVWDDLQSLMKHFESRGLL